MEKKPQDTESRHADKFIVRFPDGMRDRLKEAAVANQRTMNAEVVARLQESFRAHSDDVQLVIALESERLSARGDALGARTELLNTKAKMLEMSMSLKSLEIEKHAKRAKTDGDFAAVKKRIKELREIEAEAKGLALQGDDLIRERDKYSAEMDSFQASVQKTRMQLEKAMADYLARKQASAGGEADAEPASE